MGRLKMTLILLPAGALGMFLIYLFFQHLRPDKPQREFALEMCIASTANIIEYQHSTESQGYPVARIKALTSTGYYIMIYIPDLNVIGALEIPYSDEPKFQEVHCPAILGGDRE